MVPGHEGFSMTVISAPADWVQAVSQLRLPETADRRLQNLMDRNAEGQLTLAERDELEALADVGEAISLVRAEAFRLLGRTPL